MARPEVEMGGGLEHFQSLPKHNWFELPSFWQKIFIEKKTNKIWAFHRIIYLCFSFNCNPFQKKKQKRKMNPFVASHFKVLFYIIEFDNQTIVCSVVFSLIRNEVEKKNVLLSTKTNLFFSHFPEDKGFHVWYKFKLWNAITRMHNQMRGKQMCVMYIHSGIGQLKFPSTSKIRMNNNTDFWMLPTERVILFDNFNLFDRIGQSLQINSFFLYNCHFIRSISNVGAVLVERNKFDIECLWIRIVSGYISFFFSKSSFNLLCSAIRCALCFFLIIFRNGIKDIWLGI